MDVRAVKLKGIEGWLVACKAGAMKQEWGSTSKTSARFRYWAYRALFRDYFRLTFKFKVCICNMFQFQGTPVTVSQIVVMMMMMTMRLYETTIVWT